jgi:hypothetical protein
MACRKRYIDNYESINNSNETTSINPPSKKRKLAEVEDAQNDYRAALNRFAASHVTQNEYDRYLIL